MQEQYGVENAFQLGLVKEQIKKNNLDKYGVEYYSSTDECRQKVAATNLERYGAECYFASEQGKLKIQQTTLENFGVKYAFQSDVVKDKIKRTNLDKYGCESPMQNEEIRSKAASKYKYNDISFDSSTELAMYIYLTDSNIKFKFHTTKKLQYQHKEKTKAYFCDFEILTDNRLELVEIKGTHFFKEDGTMQNPYDHTQDDLYEAKHQCMLSNNVHILKDTSLCLQYIYKYIDEKYGKDYLQQFKNCNKSK